ncbi:hypothetical protein D9M70_554220 [compost metagenome]
MGTRAVNQRARAEILHNEGLPSLEMFRFRRIANSGSDILESTVAIFLIRYGGANYSKIANRLVEAFYRSIVHFVRSEGQLRPGRLSIPNNR